MKPFEDIQLFLRVIELGSIRAAATEVGLEPSSVSRKLTALERRLNSRLLERGARKSEATESGALYYRQMRQLLPQIEAAEQQVSGDATQPQGLLKVNASIDFGQRFVAPWLLAFRYRYPNVEVQLSLSSEFVDLSRADTDIALRIGRLSDSALHARKLADVPRVLVASKRYLDQHGEPQTPEQLADHEHIFFSARNRQQPLRLTDEQGKEHQVMRQGGITINAVNSVVQAVQQGWGIHAGPRWAFQQALDSGELVELLSGYRQYVMPLNALWRSSVLLPARMRVFIDFCREQVQQVPGLEPVG